MIRTEEWRQQDWRSFEYWTQDQLRAFLSLEGKGKYRTWTRIKPLLATARLDLPVTKLYHAAKVRALLEGRLSRHSPLRSHRSLRNLRRGPHDLAIAKVG